MMFKGSKASFQSVEIMVLRTEWLVCRAVNHAASLIDFMKEPSKFLPSGCFLYQIMETGLVIAARSKGESSLFISGGCLASYSRKNLTGQRGPAVAYIFRLKLWSGTNWFSPVRVLLPRSPDRPLSVLFSLGPVFSFNLEVAELHSVVFITSPPAKEHGVVEPYGTQKTLGGIVSQLFC